MGNGQQCASSETRSTSGSDTVRVIVLRVLTQRARCCVEQAGRCRLERIQGSARASSSDSRSDEKPHGIFVMWRVKDKVFECGKVAIDVLTHVPLGPVFSLISSKFLLVPSELVADSLAVGNWENLLKKEFDEQVARLSKKGAVLSNTTKLRLSSRLVVRLLGKLLRSCDMAPFPITHRRYRACA